MPNVAGVQFPYTLQGQEAAQQYQSSLSPAQGLGFRPLRMQEGGSAEARIIAQGLYALMSDGTNEQVQAYINDNRSDLEEIAKIDNRMFDMLRNVLSQFPVQSDIQGAPMEGEPAGNLGRIEDSVAASPGQQMMAQPQGLNENLFVGSTPVSLGGTEGSGAGQWPSYGTMGDYRMGLSAAMRGGPHWPTVEIPTGGFVEGPPPTGVLEEFSPEGMRHGGVPRGTVAGELEPRGYLTARQAGETMRERAKGLRGQRNYGGGIGSLYNRYG
jgi:hypothetical protein